MTIKCYGEDFELLACFPTRQRAVLCMLFNDKRSELITGGVDGLKIWYHAKREEKHESDETWSYHRKGKIIHVLENRYKIEAWKQWVTTMHLDTELQRLYAISNNR